MKGSSPYTAESSLYFLCLLQKNSDHSCVVLIPVESRTWIYKFTPIESSLIKRKYESFRCSDICRKGYIVDVAKAQKIKLLLIGLMNARRLSQAQYKVYLIAGYP